MRILALVPARGGSKGFPGKNLALLAGEALVRRAWGTLARLRVRHPELQLCLSTDSPEIAAAWPERERPRHLRPAHLATDITPTLDVIEHELARTASEGKPCDAVLLLQPTTPLVDDEDLERLLAAWKPGGAAVCVRAAEHPPEWCLRVEKGCLQPAFPLPASLRRQDLLAAWMPTGVAIADASLLLRERTFVVPGVSVAVEITQDHAIDIDHRRDLELCEAALDARAQQASISLLGREVGPGRPCFVIAEAGVNHNGDPALALRLIDAAAAAGADAVKFQTFSAAHLASTMAPKAAYQVKQTGAEESQFAMLRRLELPPDAWQALKQRAADRRIAFLSTPFDPPSASLLASLGLDAFKISSGDLTCHPLLTQVASAGRPMILSTGMATLDEVESALGVLGGHPVALLHCVSSYPAPPEAANLRAMATLARRFKVPVGWSDHTQGHDVTVAAVALGACIVEKHLTLDRGMQGPDHAASLDPEQFEAMVRAIRLIGASLGDGRKRPQDCELEARRIARKSLVAARALEPGQALATDDVACLRPGDGLSPARLSGLLGRRVLTAIEAGEQLREEHLAQEES